MRRYFPCVVFIVAIVTLSFSHPTVVREAAGSKTLMETLMDEETFKSCGLQKLTEAELRNLEAWIVGLWLAGTSLLQGGDLEEAVVVKDFDGDTVIIRRANGEYWVLRAKSWCRWLWKYEGKRVLLKFGYTTSKLISNEGDVCEFWTEEQL